MGAKASKRAARKHARKLAASEEEEVSPVGVQKIGLAEIRKGAWSLSVSNKVRATPVQPRPAPERDGPSALQAVGGFVPDGPSSSSSSTSALISASTAVRSPLTGPGKVEHSSHEWRWLLNTIFVLFDVNKDGYLLPEDLRALALIFGLDELDGTMHSGFGEPPFASWLLSTGVDLLFVRYPFKLLRLVGRCFQEERYQFPREVNVFMSLVLERTFGQKMNYELDLFAFDSILMKMLDGCKKDQQEQVEILARRWGVTTTEAQVVMGEANNYDWDGDGCFEYALFGMTILRAKNSSTYGIRWPRDPSDFFPLMVRDDDGFLSASEIRQFASMFNQELSSEAIDLVMGAFDRDGDGRVSREDFRIVMASPLDGASWQVWLVGIVLAILLVANPTILE